MKSIRTKLIIIFIIFIILISTVITYVSSKSSGNVIIKQLEETLELTAIEATKLVSSRLATQLAFMEGISEREIILDKTPLKEKMKVLQSEADRMGYDSLGIVDLNGYALKSDGETVDIADRDYFIAAAQGQSCVSDVIISRTTGQPIITYAVPIIRDDIIEGVLYGVRDGNNLSMITNDITYGENGYAFIVNENGTNIAHPNAELIINQYNVIEDAKENKEFKELADIMEGKMIKGETGVEHYFFSGADRIMGFAPVPGTGWSFAVTTDVKDAMEGVVRLRNLIFLFDFIIIIIGAVLAFLIGRSFANPIILAVEHAEIMAKGDFTNKIPEEFIKRKDEIGTLAQTLDTMQNSLKVLIGNVLRSSEMIGATSQELSASTEEISSSAQNQASTTEEVSSSIQEMAASTHLVSGNMKSTSQNVGIIANTMGEIEDIINNNTKDVENINYSIGEILTAMEATGESINTISHKSKEASKEAEDTVFLASEGKGNLDRTVNQMESIQKTILSLAYVIGELGESADQIGDITEIIKDIAEQTNLLALNASIEAARAGDHGKGFAVVAQAIGNLSEESSNATKEIAKVIKNIQTEIGKAVKNSEEGTQVVESGTHLVKETSNSLEKIFGAIQVTSNVINEITTQMDIQSKDTQSVYVSAKSINDKINNLMAAMEEETAGATEIKNEIESINHLVNEISMSMQQQSEASEQVSSAVNDNAAGIEEISTSSEDIAKSAEELAKNAQELVVQVQQFKI